MVGAAAEKDANAPERAQRGSRRGRAQQRSVYSTRAQWAAIGARAVEAGLSVSRFFVGCALDKAEPEVAPRQDGLFDHRLALAEKEQRTLYERVAVLERFAQALLGRAPGAQVSLLEALLVLGGATGPDDPESPGGCDAAAGERLGRSGAPRLSVHSISCTNEEWEQVRVRAARAGQSISRYLVKCALSAPLPGSGASEPSPRLVLDEAQQHTLYERVERIAKHLGGVGARPRRSQWNAALERAVEALLDRAFDDRGRESGSMRTALARVVGTRRTARVAARLEARRRGGELPE